MFSKNLKNFINIKTLTSFQNKKKASLSKKSSQSYFVKKIDYKKYSINKQIEETIFNFKQPKTSDFVQIWSKKESFNQLNIVSLIVKKEQYLNLFFKKRQIFYFIKDIILAANFHNKFLIKQQNFLKNQITNFKQFYIIEQTKFNMFSSLYFSGLVFNYNNLKNKNLTLKNFSLITKIIFNKYNSQYFLAKSEDKNYNINLNQLNFLLYFLNSHIHKWNNVSVESITSSTSNYNINKIILIKKISSFYLSKNFINIPKINYEINYNNNNPAKVLWKNNNAMFLQSKNLTKANNHFFINNHGRLINFSKNNFLINRFKTRNDISTNIIYLLFRLEEKIDVLNKNNKILAKELTKLYNFINILINKKNTKNLYLGLILSNLNEIFKIKKTTWRFLFLRSLNQWINKETKTSQIVNFWKKLYKHFIYTKNLQKRNYSSKKNILTNKIFYKINKKKFFFSLNIKKSNVNTRIATKKFLINEKLQLKNNYIDHNNIKTALSLLTKKNVNIFFINALALTKYAFNLERQLEKKEKRSPNVFLQNIDRDIINKYKYIGIYIKDLIRVCFIGMFLKKPTFIAQFIAFQITKLPRNRKETSFIRFIIKIVKTFAAEREEITGLRIKFKGRVNRWRRTKSIIGERGIIPLHTINNRIEFGNAQAINRKGALGISIWIRYKESYSALIKESILKYFIYSKQLKIKNKLIKNINFTKKI